MYQHSDKVGTRKWCELQLKLVQLVPYHFINFTQKCSHYIKKKPTHYDIKKYIKIIVTENQVGLGTDLVCKNENLSVNPSTHTRSQHGFAGLEPSSRAQRQSIPRASCPASPTETVALLVQGEALSQGNKVEGNKGRQPVSCSGSHMCVVQTQYAPTHTYKHVQKQISILN